MSSTRAEQIEEVGGFQPLGFASSQNMVEQPTPAAESRKSWQLLNWHDYKSCPSLFRRLSEWAARFIQKVGP